MPRISRENSKTITQTYHLIIRGINKQDIFFDDYDKKKFLKEIERTKEKYQYEIYAYVLMNNHVHITIFDKNDNKSNVVHSICTSYAEYFNKKYERKGHLFQNRFKSLCVDTDRYLLNLVRYIHQNHEKDGICKMETYKWSSYKEYLGSKGITDTNFILEMLSSDREEAIKKFIIYSKKIDREFSDGELEGKKLTDEEAIENIKRITKLENLQAVQLLDRKLQEQYILKISNINGISVEQIARILGINKRKIYRVKNKYKENV